jgi:hypothetical protein
MDLPILRYLDILIGLAVVIFLGATVVASVSQLVLWRLGLRARTLRVAIEELLIEIYPSLRGADGRAIAELLLRHPLLGQSQGPLSRALNWIQNRVRGGRVPRLPPYHPAEVIQRHELAMFLLEWAAGEGPLGTNGDLNSLRAKIREALGSNGISDPAGVIQGIRFKSLQNEKDHASLPSHLWAEHALIEEAPSALLAKIYTSFDNTMRRAVDDFTVQAKLVSSAVALVLAVIIQLDALGLVKRLSVDESLRESLVQEAEMLTDRIGDKQTSETANTEEAKLEEPEVEKARAALDEIDATLALLREPKYAAIPDTLVWEKLAQKTYCPPGVQGSNPWKGVLELGTARYNVTATGPLTARSLEKGIADSRAPVYRYEVDHGDDRCLQIVARFSDVSLSSLRISADTGVTPKLLPKREKFAIDREGIRRRAAGVLFSWILLSLGAPYWFELLKNLLKLRSVVADKDDKERKTRETQEEAKPLTGKVPGRSGTLTELEGEAGDLGRAAVG